MARRTLSISTQLFLALTIILVTLVWAVPRAGADAAGGIQSEPLAPRSTTDDGAETMFQSLDPARTGVNFIHEWTPPEEHKERIDSAFVTAGVCIGDYDSDGLPDIYMTRAFGGSKLFRNLGDFKFEDVTEQAGLADGEAWDVGPAFADVDNDGDLDLYVCSHMSANRLYLNQGDGTFKQAPESSGLAYNGVSIMMAFADYDLDGDLDAYLLTNRPKLRFDEDHVQYKWKDGRWHMPEKYLEMVDLITRPDGTLFVKYAGEYDHLYRNNGDGTYTEVTEEAGIQGNDIGLSATWWDYDGDGRPDLYIGNDFEGDDRLYHNNGDGTFTNTIVDSMPHTPWFAMGADFGDLNNDGRLDLLVADMQSTTHYKSKLTMGDMENMGWFLETPRPPQYMRSALYINSGTDRFLEGAFLAGLASTDWTWAPKSGDFDCDGWLDMYFTNGMSRYWMNSDFIQMTRGMTTSESMRMKEEFFEKQPKRAEENLAYRNRGDLKFDNVSKEWGLDHFGVSSGAALGDLDNDGDLDVVAINLDEPSLIYRNNSTSGHRIKLRLQGTNSNRWGVGATVKIRTAAGQQMRYVTLARGYAATNEPMVFFGLGEHDTADQLTVQWPGGHVQTFENLAADRFYTITEPSGPAPPIQVAQPEPTMFEPVVSKLLKRNAHHENRYDDFQRQPLLPNRMSQLGPGMAWGDIDGDGDDDLYVGGAADSAGMMWINRGDANLGKRACPDLQDDFAFEDMAPLFFDADGDGDQDLYVVSGGYEFEKDDPLLQDRLYLNDGAGMFTRAPDGTLPTMLDSGSSVTAADFDRDGDLDLFVGGRMIPGEYPLTPNSYLLQNDGGTFTDVTDQLAPGLKATGLVTSAVWSDADGDGWLDLLITHEWGPVKLWRNDGGTLADRTHPAGLLDRVGWYNGIAARDIDHDGDIDYVVTNFGLNTKYHASEEHPSLLYYGDFDGSGIPHLVEAEFEDETLFPKRGKSCSTNAMPHLGELLPTFDKFANATLEEIYTPETINEAKRYAATSLESGVLINDGRANFTFQPLPRLAQISPGFGVVMTEVDGDGHADLYIAQNFYTAQRETGHMDGGVSQLLLGRGDGTFEPVWPDRSGLMVPGDGMGLTATDLNDDGWPDFVVGVNNEPIKMFINRGHESNRTFALSLDGRNGNTTAVGARVTVELDDGTTQTAEIHAGSSYLSQSSGQLVFGLGARGHVASLTVHWPDGQTSAHTPDPQLTQLSLEQPTSEARAAE